MNELLTQRVRSAYGVAAPLPRSPDARLQLPRRWNLRIRLALSLDERFHALELRSEDETVAAQLGNNE